MTKRDLRLIERYKNSNAHELRDVYNYYSRAKQNAFNDCLKRMESVNGRNLLIVGAGSCTFSVMFELPNGDYCYITKDNERIIKHD